MTTTPTTPDPADGDAIARDVFKLISEFWEAGRPSVYAEWARNEIDEMTGHIAAALRQARQDGARDQMEKDCAEVCEHCADGETLFDGIIHMRQELSFSAHCKAASIRAAWESEK